MCDLDDDSLEILSVSGISETLATNILQGGLVSGLLDLRWMALGRERSVTVRICSFEGCPGRIWTLVIRCKSEMEA